MTISKFGVERDIYNQIDFLNFPVVPHGELTVEQRSAISEMAADFRRGKPSWAALNTLVAEIYGLSSFDEDLVADALEFENPYPASKVRALAHVGEQAPCVRKFAQSLASIIAELEGVEVVGAPCAVTPEGDRVWQFVRLTVGEQFALDSELVRALLRRLPDTLMSSEIRLQVGPRDWLIGRLRQGRYWSRSQARLLALDLIHQGLFPSDH